eukprot:GEMP01013721.1.p1 GENE.GEMP01013721.1~~GEMP01013721.1.p1  ORF type:complete len:711 (+),score=144.81 GEMP01013721.1:513-2645(+)
MRLLSYSPRTRRQLTQSPLLSRTACLGAQRRTRRIPPTVTLGKSAIKQSLLSEMTMKVSPQVVPTSSAKLEVEMETEEQALQRWTSSIEASLHFLDESAASNYRASVDHEHTSSTGHPLLTREYLAEQYQQITTKLSDVYSCCESPDLTAIWSRLEHAKEIDVERAEGRFLAAVDSWMEAHITRDSRLVDLEVGDPMGALAMKKSAENRMLEILNVIENDEEHHCLHWKLIGMDKFIAELPNYFRSKLRKMLKKDDAAVADDRSAEYAFDEPVLRELFMLRDVRESVSRLFRDEPVPNGGEQPSNGLTAVEADSGANAASPHIDERKRAGSATGWSKVEVAATVRREASRTFLRRRWLELGEAATAMVALTSRADGRMLKDNLARYVLTFASQRMKDESEVLSDEKEITKLFDALLKFQEESAGQKEPDQFELAVPIENVLAKLTTDETLDVARLQGSATLSEAIDTIRALLVDKKLARLPNALWSSWLGVSGALDISIRLSILSNDRRCVEAITVERLSLERLSFSKATIDVQGVLGAVHNLMQACSQDSAIMADEPLNFDTLLALPTISESTRLSLLLHDPAQPEFDLYLRAWAIAQNYVEKDAGQAGLHLLSVWRRRQVAPLEARALRNETARSQLAARAYLEALDPSDAMHIGPFIRQTQIGVEKELTKCHTEESFVEICGSIQALAMLAQLAQQDAPRSETPART